MKVWRQEDQEDDQEEDKSGRSRSRSKSRSRRVGTEAYESRRTIGSRQGRSHNEGRGGCRETEEIYYLTCTSVSRRLKGTSTEDKEEVEVVEEEEVLVDKEEDNERSSSGIKKMHVQGEEEQTGGRDEKKR
eukprot:761299-Hanusia_phi.AAC.3